MVYFSENSISSKLTQIFKNDWVERLNVLDEEILLFHRGAHRHARRQQQPTVVIGRSSWLDELDEELLLRGKHAGGDAHGQQHIELLAGGPFRQHGDNG